MNTYPVHVKGPCNLSDEALAEIVEMARKKVGLQADEILKAIYVHERLVNFVTRRF